MHSENRSSLTLTKTCRNEIIQEVKGQTTLNEIFELIRFKPCKNSCKKDISLVS